METLARWICAVAKAERYVIRSLASGYDDA
jgi:hypothetical protein